MKTNAENLRQYKSRFSLIVMQIPAVTLKTNLVREVKQSCVSKLQTDCMMMLYFLDNSHSDR